MDWVRTSASMSADNAGNAGADADNAGIVRIMDTSVDNAGMSAVNGHKMGSSGRWAQAAGACLQGAALIFIIVIVLLTSSCGGDNAISDDDYEVPSAPTLERPVRDETGTLTSEDIDRISSTIANNPDDPDSPQIAVLMVGSIPDGETVEEASLEVARAWGVGGEDRKNGVLFYVAKNDHEMRIEVADGVGEYLTDVESARILDDYAKPAFRDDKYADGINDSVGLIREEVDGEPGVSYVQQDTTSISELADTADWDTSSFIAVLIVLALALVGFIDAMAYAVDCAFYLIDSAIRLICKIRHKPYPFPDDPTKHHHYSSSGSSGGYSGSSSSSSSSSGSSFGGGGGFSGGGSSSSW